MGDQLTLLLQHAYNGIAIGALYALIAVGITVVYGLSRIIHFAVGELVMLGAFIAWMVVRATGSYGWGLIAAVVSMALIGLLTERAVFRFTLREPLTGFIVSLGLILVLQGIALEIWSPNPRSSLPPFPAAWEVAGIVVRKQTVANTGLVVAVLALSYVVLMKTTYGKALRAVSDDPAASALMGIPVRTIIMTTFVVGAALAGIGGTLVLTIGSVTPFIGASYLLRGFAVALIGGLGNIQGAALAGIGLGVVESLAAGYVGPGWTDAYVFSVVILILLWRPTGLAGGSEGARLTDTAGTTPAVARAILPRLAAMSSAPFVGVSALGLIAALLPYGSPSGQVLSLAITALIFGMCGAGLGFLWGQTGQLTLAHAAVFGIGAYTASILAKHFGIGFAASLPICIATGLLAGIVVALPSLRTGGHYFVILTFAIGEVINVLEMRWESMTGGVNGLTISPGSQSILGLRLAERADYYIVVTIFATLVFLLLCLLMRSRWGIILRGTRENPELATSMGVNVPVHRVMAFAVSGAIAGLAGQLYVYHLKFLAPEQFTSQLSIIFLLVVLLGGKSFLLGPALGAVIYVFLPEFIGLSPVRSQIAFGAILIVMILSAPGGILSLINRAPALARTPSGIGEGTGAT